MAGISEIDLFDVPPLRQLKEMWNTPFANMRIRQEARTLLITELAEAVRQGVPLDEALFMAGKTESELRREQQGKHPRFGSLSVLFGLLMLCFVSPLFGLLFGFYPVLAGRFANLDAIVKHYGQRMAAAVVQGHSLSRAMAYVPFGFTRQEVEIVAQAEKWGTVPDALTALSRFGRTEHRISQNSTYGIYPLLIICILFTCMGFIAMKVLPKLQNIYEQLGIASDPYMLLWLNSIAIVTGRLSTVMLPFLAAVVSFIILRHIMNGSAWSKVYFCAIIVPGSIFFLISILRLVAGEDAAPSPVWVAGGFLLGGVALLMLPAIMVFVERLILRIESVLDNLFLAMPIIGGMKRMNHEAIYLAAYQSALRAGMDECAAVRSSGEVIGASMRRKSIAAAELIEQGHSPSSAFARVKLLRGDILRRLAIIENRDGYLDRLHEIGSDIRFETDHSIERAARLIEVIELGALALPVFLFAAAIYIPLSRIAMLMG